MNTCVCVRAYGHQTNKRADRKEEIKTLLRWAREAHLVIYDTAIQTAPQAAVGEV